MLRCSCAATLCSSSCSCSSSLLHHAFRFGASRPCLYPVCSEDGPSSALCSGWPCRRSHLGRRKPVTDSYAHRKSLCVHWTNGYASSTHVEIAPIGQIAVQSDASAASIEYCAHHQIAPTPPARTSRQVGAGALDPTTRTFWTRSLCWPSRHSLVRQAA